MDKLASTLLELKLINSTLVKLLYEEKEKAGLTDFELRRLSEVPESTLRRSRQLGSDLGLNKINKQRARRFLLERYAIREYSPILREKFNELNRLEENLNLKKEALIKLIAKEESE